MRDTNNYAIEIILKSGAVRYVQSGKRFEKYSKTLHPNCVFNRNAASARVKMAIRAVGTRATNYENEEGCEEIIAVRLLLVNSRVEEVPAGFHWNWKKA